MRAKQQRSSPIHSRLGANCRIGWLGNRRLTGSVRIQKDAELGRFRLTSDPCGRRCPLIDARPDP